MLRFSFHCSCFKAAFFTQVLADNLFKWRLKELKTKQPKIPAYLPLLDWISFPCCSDKSESKQLPLAFCFALVWPVYPPFPGGKASFPSFLDWNAPMPFIHLVLNPTPILPFLNHQLFPLPSTMLEPARNREAGCCLKTPFRSSLTNTQQEAASPTLSPPPRANTAQTAEPHMSSKLQCTETLTSVERPPHSYLIQDWSLLPESNSHPRFSVLQYFVEPLHARNTPGAQGLQVREDLRRMSYPIPWNGTGFSSLQICTKSRAMFMRGGECETSSLLF